MDVNVKQQAQMQQRSGAGVALAVIVIVIDTPRNDIDALRPCMPAVREAIEQAKPDIPAT